MEYWTADRWAVCLQHYFHLQKKTNKQVKQIKNNLTNLTFRIYARSDSSVPPESVFTCQSIDNWSQNSGGPDHFFEDIGLSS